MYFSCCVCVFVSTLLFWCSSSISSAVEYVALFGSYNKIYSCHSSAYTSYLSFLRRSYLSPHYFMPLLTFAFCYDN